MSKINHLDQVARKLTNMDTQRCVVDLFANPALTRTISTDVTTTERVIISPRRPATDGAHSVNSANVCRSHALCYRTERVFFYSFPKQMFAIGM